MTYSSLTFSRHGIQQEIETQCNDLVKQKNELLDKQIVAQNERKKLLDEKKLWEDRVEPILDDIKKLQYYFTYY
jgi:peptidoglycan hydrolase CwlO-like protein